MTHCLIRENLAKHALEGKQEIVVYSFNAQLYDDDILKAFPSQIAHMHLFFEWLMSSDPFNGYPIILYLSYHNDQNQLALGCTTTSADQSVPTHHS
jgi:hypothetical protein